MSHHVQDELLEAAASVLLCKIKAELHRQYFAILADEYKDLAKRDLVAICVWFIHGRVIKERICLRRGYHRRSWRSFAHLNWILLSVSGSGCPEIKIPESHLCTL